MFDFNDVHGNLLCRCTSLFIKSEISTRPPRHRASAYIDRIEAALTALATFPERGSVRNDLVPNLRIIGFERRVSIAFIVKGDIVEIQRIFYGGQDYAEEWPG
jgi:toxin ParE1/3/4